MTKLNISEISPEDTMRLMSAISGVARLTEGLAQCMGTVVSSAKQGDYDVPHVYGTIANTVLGVAENLERISSLQDKYDGISVDNLVDAWGVDLSIAMTKTSNLWFLAYGAAATAVDRTIIPALVRDACNETAIVSAEPLPFPDDATPDQAERAKVMMAYAEEVKGSFEEELAKHQSGNPADDGDDDGDDEGNDDKPTLH
jgi:hypothetical protein